MQETARGVRLDQLPIVRARLEIRIIAERLRLPIRSDVQGNRWIASPTGNRGRCR